MGCSRSQSLQQEELDELGSRPTPAAALTATDFQSTDPVLRPEKGSLPPARTVASARTIFAQ